jgi:hypothetical protein
MENTTKQFTPDLGERRTPIRNTRKYKGELQLCQEALHERTVEKNIYRSVCIGLAMLAAIALFLLASTLKGNNALRQEALTTTTK